MTKKNFNECLEEKSMTKNGNNLRRDSCMLV